MGLVYCIFCAWPFEDETAMSLMRIIDKSLYSPTSKSCPCAASEASTPLGCPPENIDLALAFWLLYWAVGAHPEAEQEERISVRIWASLT
jgi:hypothetical protein